MDNDIKKFRDIVTENTKPLTEIKVKSKPISSDDMTGIAVDWKASPESVFKTIDQLLKKFNLEVVLYNDNVSDAWVIDIQEKKANPAAGFNDIVRQANKMRK